MKKSLQVYLILAIVFYVAFSIISVNINIFEWGIFLRAVYVFGALISVKILFD